MVVTARALRPVSASYARIDAYELSAVPRRTAEDALRLVPGFTLVQHGSEGKGHQFFLRGFSAVPRRTAEDALRLVPGFTLVQHGSEGKGHQFFLRGFDAVHGADLEITVDGIPVNEWSNIHAQGYLDLGFIIGEAIDSVEVVKPEGNPVRQAKLG